LGWWVNESNEKTGDIQTIFLVGFEYAKGLLASE